ncbi:hypothetical protein D9756_005737 [Leucocoprinus leucothites]|uniref:Integral membrane protein n=1 Tax=Leucocoprinus leucothites TaxID=201217 RepID=A0A8H5FZX8_9AGAR|nr:hypothetical protein D9756_005737 [Leucoagaricus leucothites]
MAELKVERGLSIALASVALVTTLVRIFIRLRSAPRRAREDYWSLPQSLSDALIILGTMAEGCAAALWTVISLIQDNGGTLIISFFWHRIYRLLWRFKGMNNGVVPGNLVCQDVGVTPPSGRRPPWNTQNLDRIVAPPTCINTAVCSTLEKDSKSVPCSLSKEAGVFHIVVYPVATAWLLWIAHRTIDIEWRMAGYKWRVFGISVGGDLVCTLISIIRGVMIIAGSSGVAIILGIVECGVAIPIANMPIIVPGLCNFLENLLKTKPSRSPSPVTFRVPTASHETDKEQSIESSRPEATGDIELLALPSSPVSPTVSVAGSTSSLLPRPG